MKVKIINLILVLGLLGSLCLAGAVPISASSTYYVSISGDDTYNDGSESSPWKTISNALLWAVSGSTIIVEPGVYQEQLNITNSVTLQGSGANVTRIVAPQVADMTVYDSFGYNATTVLYDAGGTTRAASNIPVVRIIASDVVISDLTIDLNSQTYLDQNTNQSGADYSKGVGILVDHDLETPTAFTGITLQNNQITGMQIGDQADGIKVLGRATVTVTNNIVYGYGENGITFRSQDNGAYAPTGTVTSNTVYGGPSTDGRSSNFYGISFWTAATGTVSSNVIYNAPSSYGVGLAIWTGGAMSISSNSLLTDGGTVGGTGAWLYDTNATSTGIAFSYNTVQNQTLGVDISRGLVETAVTDITLQNNRFYECTGGILSRGIAAGGSILVQNNDFIRTGILDSSYAVQTTDDTDPDPDWSNELEITATNNWWGHTTGPNEATENPDAYGGNISGSLVYCPWLLVPYASVYADTEITNWQSSTSPLTYAGTDVVLTLTTSNTAGSITVTTSDCALPPNVSAPLTTYRPLKYLAVYSAVANNTLGSQDIWIQITYTDAELTRMGVKEADLQMYYFDLGDSTWKAAGDLTQDTDGNTVSATVNEDELTKVNSYGTPVCLAGDPELTGQYEIGDVPDVTVNFIPEAMDATVEQTVEVSVNLPANQDRQLSDLTSLTFKTWYSAAGGIPYPSEFSELTPDSQTCAVISWTSGGGFTLSAGDGSWVLGTCSAPALSGTTGTFILKFRPGKIAQETATGSIWQMAATATDEYGTGFSYDPEGVVMNFYGELYLTGLPTVSWGSVPAGMDFTNTKSSKDLGNSIVYITNGDYNMLAKSSASWTSSSVEYSATLNTSGESLVANEFSLKCDDGTDESYGVVINSVGSQFGSALAPESEAGTTAATNTLWLKLSSTFSLETEYSGTITYMVSPVVE